MNRLKFITKSIIMILFLMLGGISISWGADTTETYDPGASDFEFFTGFHGLSQEEKKINSEVVLGFGFNPVFSGYLGTSSESNQNLNSSATENSINFGLIMTLFNSENFDLDLMLDVQSFNSLSFTPALELNFDLEDDLNLAGFYLKVEEEITGSENENKRLYNTVLTKGLYFTVSQDLQLLTEFDWSYDHDQSEKNVGGVALGVNWRFSDSIELINQIYFDIPEGSEDFGWGIDFGFVATMLDD